MQLVRKYYFIKKLYISHILFYSMKQFRKQSSFFSFLPHKPRCAALYNAYLCWKYGTIILLSLLFILLLINFSFFATTTLYKFSPTIDFMRICKLTVVCIKKIGRSVNDTLPIEEYQDNNSIHKILIGGKK